MRTELSANDVRDTKGQTQQPQHVALRSEDDERPDVGPGVEYLGGGRALQEGHSRSDGQRDDQEGPGAGAHDAVVERDRDGGAGECRQGRGFGAGGFLRGRAELGSRRDEDTHRHQQHEHHGLEDRHG
ncbi:Uncharacterised protein [Mycobacteroides abscessus subsp. massiliense]|nr:Uncharacterised protein [Mycobacteroides abscessus subsp. massiliense]